MQLESNIEASNLEIHLPGSRIVVLVIQTPYPYAVGMMRSLRLFAMIAFLAAIQPLVAASVLLSLMLLPARAWAADMETENCPDNKGFIFHPSGDRFVPWGHNYASVDIMERVAKDLARVEREFTEMKAAGTTVARIHPEMLHILTGPDTADPQALDQLKTLLKIAEKSGIHLKITGLACYKIKDRMAWYDSMDEHDRWQTQAFFWETIAQTCAESPAVFAYDLVNEPAAVGKQPDGWYMGKMGDVEFCQRLSLSPGNRNGDEIFREWTKQHGCRHPKTRPNAFDHDGNASVPWRIQSSGRTARFCLAASVSQDGQGR